jgi:hypothetical protein
MWARHIVTRGPAIAVSMPGETLFCSVAATAAGLVLGHRLKPWQRMTPGGLILPRGRSCPMLVLVGIYIVIHGHLTPGRIPGRRGAGGSIFRRGHRRAVKRVNHAISVIEGGRRRHIAYRYRACGDGSFCPAPTTASGQLLGRHDAALPCGGDQGRVRAVGLPGTHLNRRPASHDPSKTIL